MIIVEKIEGNIIVIEDNGKMRDILITEIINNTLLKEGCLLEKVSKGYWINEKDTEIRRTMLSKKLEFLFKR